MCVGVGRGGGGGQLAATQATVSCPNSSLCREIQVKVNKSYDYAIGVCF